MAEALAALKDTPYLAGGAQARPGLAAAPAHTTTLAVANMHCGACLRNVEQTLCRLPGVAGARVNLSSKRVAIFTSGPPHTADAFIDALKQSGFDAVLLADPLAAPTPVADGDLNKRLGVAGFAATNIMLLSVAVWSGQGSDMPASLQTMFHWLSALIALPAVAYAGQPFFKSARQALGGGRLNMDVPISVGVLLATAMSLFQTVRGGHQVYFDAAVTLLFFLLIGRVLDQRMRAKAEGAAQNLLGLISPTTSVISPGGQIERIATSSVAPGTTILIAAGERVPIDARVSRNVGVIDESMITGESAPRNVGVADQLYAGTILLTGPIEAVATSLVQNTLLVEIARLMQIAEQARGRYVRLADRAARLYAPAVHVLGLATFVGWMVAGFSWEAALTAAIAVLIVTCPCALALAVPVVQVVAIGRLFREGVVMKASDGLERLAEVDTIVFDKTGTLSLGRPQVLDSCEIPDATLGLAGSLAAHSRHPYAKAIAAAAHKRGLTCLALVGVQEIPGDGLHATVGGLTIRLGSARFCDVEATAAAGQPALWFREGAAAPVMLPVGDALRPDAKDVVRKLVRAGYKVEILSGDQASLVEQAARDVGITQWLAAQRPDQKIARIEALAAQGAKVLMIGDGLNDAPALASGHAALSPAAAADISQVAADAIFQGDELKPVIQTLLVAKATRRRSLENFAIAIGYNCVFVPLAMLGHVTPLIAAIAMSASSIAVTANALRLSRQHLELLR